MKVVILRDRMMVIFPKVNCIFAPGYVRQFEPVELGMSDVLNLTAEKLQEGESLTYELSALCKCKMSNHVFSLLNE